MTDLAAVEATIRDYIEGWYSASPDRMQRCLHDDLVKRTPAEAELRAVSKERMVQLTAAADEVMADPAFDINVDDISQDIAAARVLSPGYLDYLHLARTPDGWKIANVLFHSHS
jgi:hypothetical protein